MWYPYKNSPEFQMQIIIFRIELIRSAWWILTWFLCSSGYVVKPDCLTSSVRWNLSVNTSDLEANRRSWLISLPLSGSVSRGYSKINQSVSTFAGALIDTVLFFFIIWLTYVSWFNELQKLNQDIDSYRNYFKAWRREYMAASLR